MQHIVYPSGIRAATGLGLVLLLASALVACSEKATFSGRTRQVPVTAPKQPIVAAGADAQGQRATTPPPASTGTTPGNDATTAADLACSIASSADTAKQGSLVTLTLKVVGSATQAVIDGHALTAPFSGAQHTVTAGATAAYGAVVTAASGATAKCSVVLTVVPATAPACTLTSSAVKVAPGGSADLVLAVTGDVASAKLDDQAVAPAGVTQTVKVLATKTYVAQVSGLAGTASCNVTVTVPDPPTCALRAAPQTVRLGDAATLALTIAGEAASATLEGVAVSLTGGTSSVSPAVTHTYTAAVQGLGGASTCTTRVTVQVPVALTYTANVTTTASQGYVWLASMQENVYRLKLDAARGYPLDTWTIPNGGSGGCGHRTYVSEIGLLVSDNCYHSIYRVSDDTPAQAQLIWTNPDTPVANGGVRMCVTSFRLGTQAYVGAAYMGPNGRRFVKIPIDQALPTKIDTTKAEYIDAGNDGANWGYSCFMDQQHNRFWSAYVGGAPYGIDLVTNAPLAPKDAVNGAFTMTLPAPTNLTVDLKSTNSYAISGDSGGNILSGNFLGSWFNSAAFDPVSKAVIAPEYNNPVNLLVADAGCFSTLNAADCAARSFVYPVPQGSHVNAVSSLNDGRVIGVERNGSAADIWLMALNVPTDLSKGLAFTLLKTLPNADLYMYTDFTGASLYAVATSTVVDLAKNPAFISGRPIQALSFTWRTAGNTPDAWQGLKLSVRCYIKGQSPLPDYTQIATVANAGSPTDIRTGSCAGAPPLDQVDVRTDPLANAGSAFSRVATIDINETL